MTAPPAQACPAGITLLEGDSRQVLKGLADASVDAIVCDPPYGLSGRAPCAQVLSAWLMGREFGEDRTGFMGKAWDGFVPGPAVWRECFRVLKPGGYLLAFFGSRTEDLGSIAIRLAGFERRDMIAWLYGSGFPKSLDISKAIDKAAGATRATVRIDAADLKNPPNLVGGAGKGAGADRPWREAAMARGYHELPGDVPATPEAAEWEGWGTMLKPALEPIVFAQKPLGEATYAANVLKHGVGALNIDGCRVGRRERPKTTDPKRTSSTYGAIDSPGGKLLPEARWPANVVHDGSEEVIEAFPETSSGGYPAEGRQRTQGVTYGKPNKTPPQAFTSSEGSAARFFYSAKADAADRFGTIHATVKPVDLMAWLCRLVTPPGGVVLDPFAGSGTTGVAALAEGLRAILIERDPAHMADIRTRFEHLAGGGGHSAQVKRRHKAAPVEAGGLFDIQDPATQGEARP